jgi:hypothetical protein
MTTSKQQKEKINNHTQECIDYNWKYEHDTRGECICND